MNSFEERYKRIDHNGYYGYYGYNLIDTLGFSDMLVIAAAEAKNAFGKMIDTVQREPVTIEKKGRAVAVVLSIEDYTRFELLENEFWTSKAIEAIEDGFIGKEQSSDLIQRIMNAKD